MYGQSALYVLQICIDVTNSLLPRVLVLPDDPANKPKTIVDVGCGIGGSSRYLAKKYGAQCRGITLSPVQAERGNALAAAQGLSDKVCLTVPLLAIGLGFQSVLRYE
jgi:2-polyprenyl-3-methyl-5-hydroxy-6-metoxy-1,4-benzoquinol methylase